MSYTNERHKKRFEYTKRTPLMDALKKDINRLMVVGTLDKLGTLNWNITGKPTSEICSCCGQKKPNKKMLSKYGKSRLKFLKGKGNYV